MARICTDISPYFLLEKFNRGIGITYFLIFLDIEA
jgi:hypothetical protein